MLRVLLFVFLTAALTARGSDKIDAPSEGASKSVKQPHVVAELIPEMTTIEAGKPFGMILHLKMDPGWHTYWINPGDAGLPTTIKWTLPPGFTAGPIQWPAPEQHNLGTLVTYGYEGDVYLLTTITPPATGDLPEHVEVKAKANWLVCQEACIPGKAEFSLTLDSGLLNFRLPVTNTELFKEARARLPVENTIWKVTRQIVQWEPYKGDPSTLSLRFVANSPQPAVEPPKVRFFPEQANVLSATDAENSPARGQGLNFQLLIRLQQNGDKPDHISGVVVADKPLIGQSSAVYISEKEIIPYQEPAQSGGGHEPVIWGNATPASDAGDGHRPPLQLNGDAGANGNTTPAAGADATEPVARRSTATTEAAAAAQPLLIGVLGAAFVGGLILNLMPCVLPVLSLKVFALIKHAGEHPEKAWKQGVAFAVGVVVSFWVLAGLLLALRAAGNQLGWGFQMQSPGFVAGLIVLFFVIGLNLFGVFEIGGPLVGVDQKAASHAGGSVSSFLNGALATVAATPCTAPFMGSALGFAAQQPAFVSMLIFTFLALGMAAPYLLLTIFPQSLRFVPRPGAWMESLKQFMGFLLMGTVIFLVYVFGALTAPDAVPPMLFVLLCFSFLAWVWGRWGTGLLVRFVVLVLAAVVALWLSSLIAAVGSRNGMSQITEPHDGYLDWSPEAVKAALDKGQPVFVDFTAAWCLSCKVNERVALGTSSVKDAFAQKNVALFRADWTRQDPVISQTLQKFNRDGVPLYLLYSPKSPDAPQVLPEVLTPGIVLDALGKI